MELKVNAVGKGKASKLDVAEAVFGAEYKEPLIHQVLTAYMAGSRSGTKAQRTRSEVSGGGKKPWKQKGTGRARAGTIRSPIWRGGGITFAAKPRDFSQKVNKKMYRGAMRSILSELLRQERLVCVNDFSVEEPKTKLVKEKLEVLNLTEALIITDELDENLYLGARNVPHVDVIDSSEVNPYTLVGFNNIVVTKAALEKIEASLS